MQVDKAQLRGPIASYELDGELHLLGTILAGAEFAFRKNGTLELYSAPSDTTRSFQRAWSVDIGYSSLVQMSLCGRYAASSKNDVFRIVDLRQRAELDAHQHGDFGSDDEPSPPVKAIVWSADSSRLVTASKNSIVLWNLHPLREVARHHYKQNTLMPKFWIPGTELVVAVAGSYPFRLLDIEKGIQLVHVRRKGTRSWKLHPLPIEAIQDGLLSPITSRSLLREAFHYILLGREYSTVITPHLGFSASFIASAGKVCIWDRAGLWLYDPVDWKVWSHLKDLDGRDICWHPTKPWALMYSEEGKVELYRLPTWDLLCKFKLAGIKELESVTIDDVGKTVYAVSTTGSSSSGWLGAIRRTKRLDVLQLEE